jgi:Raf kinase inhibitor-like YbhB/YbcL family protein
MRKSLVGMVGAVLFLVAANTGNTVAQQAGGAPPAPPLSLKTSAFSDGGDIPLKYGCDVAQGAPMISPDFTWTNTPAGTVSFVLIMHDTDANPAKGIMDVTHWTAFNISGSATSLPEGIKMDGPVGDGGMQGQNIRKANGYQAPCPPKGGPAHHYVFELYALDTKLDLPAGAPRADLLKAMDGHIIGKSSYIGKFHH